MILIFIDYTWGGIYGHFEIWNRLRVEESIPELKCFHNISLILK